MKYEIKITAVLVKYALANTTCINLHKVASVSAVHNERRNNGKKQKLQIIEEISKHFYRKTVLPT